MKIEEFKNTFLSKWYDGVKRNHIGKQKEIKIMSFDTETYFGHVFFSGFMAENNFHNQYGLYKDHLKWLLENLKFYVCGHKKNCTYALFGHFHEFDWGTLLWPYVFQGKLKRYPRRVFFSIPELKVTIDFYFGRPSFGRIIFCSNDSKHPKVTVHLIDTFAFFKMGLDKALETIGSNLRKLEKPEKLGSILYRKEVLYDYLKRDCEGVIEVANWIVVFHQKWDVRLTVSAPQLSGRIFRHCYLKEEKIKKPYAPIRRASMLSYHGGKNNCTVKPGIYNCTEIDIRSAYSKAMMELPDFEHGDYKTVFEFNNIHGVYQVNGYLKDCKYGCLFDHGFKKISGDIKNLWITGYELKEALDSGHLKLKSCSGFVWIENENAIKETAHKRFITEFYNHSINSKTKAEKDFYKLLRNSLYGKYIQRNLLDDGTRQGGAMFHPFIATLITGYVRAWMHKLEHQYDSIHTATDSIKTLQYFEESGKEIGTLKKEVEGPCIILRNKLYLHYNKSKELVKIGLHGFQGKAKDLQDLIKEGKKSYSIDRLVRWGESFHTGFNPGLQLNRSLKLYLDIPIMDIQKLLDTG